MITWVIFDKSWNNELAIADVAFHLVSIPCFQSQYAIILNLLLITVSVQTLFLQTFTYYTPLQQR